MRWLLERGAAGLLLKPGMGKTSVTLAAFKVLRDRGLVGSLLVIAPLRACYQAWVGEARKWEDFRGLDVALVHGPKKAEVLREEHDVYLLNPEAVPWLLGEAKHVDLPDMLVVDESTKFKHPSTKRFKALKKLLPSFDRRYILTGTPAPNGLLDLFGQVYVLDFGEALGRFITHYRLEYFYQVGYGGFAWAIRPGAEERIHARVKPLCLMLDDADYLDLPPLVEREVRVDLPPKARELYRKLEADFIARLEGGEVTAFNAGALSSKLRQVASGSVYLTDEESAERRAAPVHDAKTDAVADLVEELSGEPALVVYEFRHELPRLKRALGDPPHLGGGVSAAEGQRVIERWNAGELPVLLVHPRSAGHGLNLQGAGSAVIFHSLTWDLELYEQTVRRVWRQGQTRRVFVYRVVARGTVDQLVLDALRAKERTQNELLRALKTYARRKT